LGSSIPEGFKMLLMGQSSKNVLPGMFVVQRLQSKVRVTADIIHLHQRRFLGSDSRKFAPFVAGVVGQCVVGVCHNDGIANSLVADVAGPLKRRYDTPAQHRSGQSHNAFF